MIRKIKQIRLDEISTMDIDCPSCDTRVRHKLYNDFTARECPNCDEPYSKEVFNAMHHLVVAFDFVKKDRRKSISFEVEIKD